MSRSRRLFTLVVNPLTIPPLYYAAYRIGSWELHHDATLVNPAAAERFSSELSRLLFWVHQASGPIAVGVLTIAVVAAAHRLSRVGALPGAAGSAAARASGGRRAARQGVNVTFAAVERAVVDCRWRTARARAIASWITKSGGD